jgi:hypothetical protein
MLVNPQFSPVFTAGSLAANPAASIKEQFFRYALCPSSGLGFGCGDPQPI